MQIEGDKVEEKFKLESGIHSVQRVPPTEKRGRRQTSKIGVAIHIVKNDLYEYVENDFKVECYRGGGPGGQHRNKTFSNVRITHIPTGIQACGNTKSQKNNKRIAMETLLKRLEDQKDKKKRSDRKEDRKTQVGIVSRGSKIRTYNFLEDRVKDERKNKRFRTKEIMRGHLDLIYDSE